MARHSKKRSPKQQRRQKRYSRKQSRKQSRNNRLKGGDTNEQAKSTLLSTRSAKINERMEDLKVLLGLMDDEQWMTDDG